MSVGASAGMAIPFGWFVENELTSNFTVIGHYSYSLEAFTPKFVSRLSVAYQQFNGYRRKNIKYGFNNSSLYLQALYFYDLGMAFHPYTLLGLGVDAVRITRDDADPDKGREVYSGLGIGAIAGAGVTMKTMDHLGIFFEVNVKSSTWTDGPDISDFILRLLIGTNIYFFL